MQYYQILFHIFIHFFLISTDLICIFLNWSQVPLIWVYAPVLKYHQLVNIAKIIHK